MDLLKDFKHITSTIDLERSKPVFDCIFDMCQQEFEIHEWIAEENTKLSCRPYHEWVCTDTHVGIDVWYMSGVVVCISFQPYRKSNTEYYWVDAEKRSSVYKYLMELVAKNEDEPVFKSISEMGDVISRARAIDHKRHEKLYEPD